MKWMWYLIPHKDGHNSDYHEAKEANLKYKWKKVIYLSLLHTTLNRTDPNCPKTGLVRISDIHCSLYSECPNTGRPVWQTGRKSVRILARPVFGRPVHTFISGFQTWERSERSKNRTFISGFQTSGSNNVRFTFLFVLEPDVWKPDVISGFQTLERSERSENRTLYPVFRRLWSYFRF